MNRPILFLERRRRAAGGGTWMEASRSKILETPPGPGRAGTKRRRARAARLRWDRVRFALKLGIARTSGWRLAVQLGFSLVSVVLGIQFGRYVEAARTTTSGPLPVRPPGVEGYLPISGLMGALDWIYQGTLNTIHPAATILFLVFVGLSLALRKSFCGWICPVGFLSEWLGRLGVGLFGRNFRIWKWADVALRSLKYLLLAFFVWAIFSMTPAALNAFIQSPYNKVTDVKMLLFFVEIGSVGLIVIGILMLLSVLVQGFWCRYLCPYGALMGLFSWMSPVQVHRNADACTDCGICDRVCPARLPVSRKRSIGSVECIGCTDCVSSCPVPKALHFGTPRRKLAPGRIALAVAVLFVAATLLARVTGHWESAITDPEMRYHITHLDSPAYGHPGR
ncbi:MAG: 4Fe-4S binding protein [Candidatus Eisenbacteria bacterium]|nr:4Fe-4S binding protein [Candidatus Latescibacterota bacterium]MBD3302657.1 4Fe-4S binding protein [Candidatus Eisenbacteria bacterium]